MSAPGILSGSQFSGQIFRTVTQGVEATANTGVFGANPGATPKYAWNTGRRDAEYRETMSRLFIEVPASEVDAFLASVSAETRPLAQVLMSGASTGGTGGTGFIDFLMTGANEEFAEKAQIVDTLTDNYVAFYAGQAPPLFGYTGVLLNTYQDDQRVWMFRLYNEILRGTRLANRNLIARLRYDSFIVSGYLENLTLGLSGDTDHNSSTFSFSMRVKRVSVFTPALSVPTVVEIPATTSVLVSEGATPSAFNERSGTITPETPPTATQGPAATNTAFSIDGEQRARLHALGLTDAYIDDTAETAQEQQSPTEVDAREEEAVASQEGLDRVEETVRNNQGEVNPGNVTNDGSGGRTNIRGDSSQIDSTEGSGNPYVEVRRRAATRRRGGVPLSA